jgi:hypothetical protein
MKVQIQLNDFKSFQRFKQSNRQQLPAAGGPNRKAKRTNRVQFLKII